MSGIAATVTMDPNLGRYMCSALVVHTGVASVVFKGEFRFPAIFRFSISIHLCD